MDLSNHIDETIKLDGVFYEPLDLPEELPTKALFWLKNGVFLTGAIDSAGLPRIYDFSSNRYLVREDWEGIAYWMPLPD